MASASVPTFRSCPDFPVAVRKKKHSPLELLLVMVSYHRDKKQTGVVFLLSNLGFSSLKSSVFKAGQSMKDILSFACIRNMGQKSLPPVSAQFPQRKRHQKGCEPLEMK